jgi:hypothetical protein
MAYHPRLAQPPANSGCGSSRTSRSPAASRLGRSRESKRNGQHSFSGQPGGQAVPAARAQAPRSERRAHRLPHRGFLAVAVMIGGATAAQAAASTGPYTGPSIVVNGGITDIAVQGPNDSLKFYWADDGSSTWTAETVAGSGTTYSAPSMILTGTAPSTSPPGAGQQPRLLLGHHRHRHLARRDGRGLRHHLLRTLDDPHRQHHRHRRPGPDNSLKFTRPPSAPAPGTPRRSPAPAPPSPRRR